MGTWRTLSGESLAQELIRIIISHSLRFYDVDQRVAAIALVLRLVLRRSFPDVSALLGHRVDVLRRVLRQDPAGCSHGTADEVDGPGDSIPLV